tara:strand:+ start:65 stop:466 length:402 start_codon:yes stop_codon:yes gene_type:complete
MMELKKFLTISSLLLLSSCSWFREPEKEIVTVTEIIKTQIGVAERPKALSMAEVKWYVVTEDNFEEFKVRFKDKEGDTMFYAISVHDYENLILNMADIKRYILQQKEIIIYYENAVTEDISDNVSQGNNSKKE